MGAVGPLDVPAWQYFYKPMATDGSKTAVLLMNHRSDAADLSLAFDEVCCAMLKY